VIKTGQTIITHEAKAEAYAAMRTTILPGMRDARLVTPKHERQALMTGGGNITRGQVL